MCIMVYICCIVTWISFRSSHLQPPQILHVGAAAHAGICCSQYMCKPLYKYILINHKYIVGAAACQRTPLRPRLAQRRDKNRKIFEK